MSLFNKPNPIERHLCCTFSVILRRYTLNLAVSARSALPYRCFGRFGIFSRIVSHPSFKSLGCLGLIELRLKVRLYTVVSDNVKRLVNNLGDRLRYFKADLRVSVHVKLCDLNIFDRPYRCLIEVIRVDNLRVARVVVCSLWFRVAKISF